MRVLKCIWCIFRRWGRSPSPVNLFVCAFALHWDKITTTSLFSFFFFFYSTRIIFASREIRRDLFDVINRFQILYCRSRAIGFCFIFIRFRCVAVIEGKFFIKKKISSNFSVRHQLFRLTIFMENFRKIVLVLREFILFSVVTPVSRTTLTVVFILSQKCLSRQ